MFDAQISYASVSNYDTDNLLKSNLSGPLKTRYVNARETNHRVNEQILQHDQALIRDLDEAFATVDRMMISIRGEMAELGRLVHDDHHKLEKRLKFHKEWGVEKVVYIMHHDFVRGFEVWTERTFSAVTPFYLEIVAYCQEVLESLLYGNESDTRKLIQLETADSMVKQRLIAGERAMQNISRIMVAYNTSDPLLTYESSPRRRYDMTWITPEVVTDGSGNVITYGETLMDRLDKLLRGGRGMREVLQQAYQHQNVTTEDFLVQSDLFRSGVRGFNYYLFLFKERVALKCDEIALELERDFNDRVAKYTAAHEQLDFYVDGLLDFLEELDEAWGHLTSLRELANDYAANPFLRKTIIAEAFTSDTTKAFSTELQAFFAEIRSRSRNIRSLITSLQMTVEELWINMLNDTSIDGFYAAVLDDIAKLRNDTEYDTLVYTFSKLLKTSKDFIKNNTDSLEVLMNADFVTMTVDQQLKDIRDFYDRLDALNDVDSTITNEKLFFDAFNVFESELEVFLDESDINIEFYRYVP